MEPTFVWDGADTRLEGMSGHQSVTATIPLDPDPDEFWIEAFNKLADAIDYVERGVNWHVEPMSTRTAQVRVTGLSSGAEIESVKALLANLAEGAIGRAAQARKDAEEKRREATERREQLESAADDILNRFRDSG